MSHKIVIIDPKQAPNLLVKVIESKLLNIMSTLLRKILILNIIGIAGSRKYYETFL